MNQLKKNIIDVQSVRGSFKKVGLLKHHWICLCLTTMLASFYERIKQSNHLVWSIAVDG